MAKASAQPFAPQRRIATEAVRQHVEQAAFLWAQRETWSREDPPDETAISDISNRVELNLDGLRIAGAAAWPFVERQLDDFPHAGEFFVAGWMAMEHSDTDRIEAIVAAAEEAGERRGLTGALAWHRPPTVGHLVRDWLTSPTAFKRYLAVGACVEHVVDPKQLLNGLVKDTDAATRALSFRLAGKLKRGDLARDMAAGLNEEDQDTSLWAGWALAELGSGDLARNELRRAAATGGPDSLMALRAAIRTSPEKDVRAWLGGLMKSAETAPVAVRGIGMLGDRSVLPWLIQRMREPYVAVAACAAFRELFPEARAETKMFTVDPTELGPAFARHFEDDVVTVALPDNVEAWGKDVNG